MNDSMCPVCGKPNSDKVETCQYCGAILMKSATEPLPIIRPGDNPIKANTSDLERTLPGWLRDARKASKKDINPKKTDDSTPILKAVSQSGEPAASKKPKAAPPADLLAGLSQLDDEGEETPDWLKTLQNSLPASPQAEPESKPELQLETDTPPSTKPFLNEDDLGFTDKPAFSPFHESMESAHLNTQDSPNKVDDFNDQGDASSPAPSEWQSAPEVERDQSIYEDLPEWLSALTSVKESFPAQPGAKPLEQQQTPKGEDPDWLLGLGSEFNTEAPAAAAAEPASLKDDETPDWLARMGTDSLITEEPISIEKTPSTDIPNWIASLQDPAPAPVEESSAPPTGDIPDWITSLQAPAPVEESSAPPAGDIPDWMIETISAKPGKQTISPQKTLDHGSIDEIAPHETGNELPAWIANLGETNQAENKTSAESVSTPASLEIPGIPGTNEVRTIDNAPERSSAFVMDAKSVEPEIKTQDKSGAANLIQAETAPIKASPFEVEALTTTPAGDQNIDSILSMDTPDWLSGFMPVEAAQNAALVEENLADDDLHPAELPSWVQAMRPVESVMAENSSSEVEQEIENQGPLAGLRSVLPTQSNLVEAFAPKVYSTKLMVSETQQAQAALLENLLNFENSPQIISKRSEANINRPLRWVIAAVLLTAILIPAILGSTIFPTPVLPVEPNPISMFIKTVADLPDDAPILVIMDYQPGFAGEMEATTGPVIEHLMSKKARLAFVSTSPLGGLMADRLMQKLDNIFPYQQGIQYINLGYLPGGASSIKAFAEQPRSTLGQDTLSGDLWDTPALKGVTINQETRLSNFAMVIVATDNPETGRLWIEQAQPMLSSRPMLMVVSAQAEPMIRPYLLSSQIQGLVAGLEGGTLYESAQGKTGQARTYWDAFGVAMISAELIILIGGAWSLISGLRTRQAAVEQDEA